MSDAVHPILSPGAGIATLNAAKCVRRAASFLNQKGPHRLFLLMGLLAMFSSLFGTSCSKNTIHSEFINAKDGTLIAVSDMPPEQLPETFAISTTLEMNGKNWSVDRAEPQERSDILRAGKVRVYLSPITMIPTGDILFSLPTISDDMGAAAGDRLPSPEIFALHEDDWRQVEFVAQKFSTEVDAEFADILRIHQEQRAGVGFKKVHIRKRIPNPLTGYNLSLQKLETTVTPQKKFQAIGFQRAPGTIPRGFAWEIDRQCVLWGVTDSEGNVARLCLLGMPSVKSAAISDSFVKLNKQYQIVFVDWCRATSITTDADAFNRHFARE